MDKFNQAEKIEDKADNLKYDLTEKNLKNEIIYDSGKDKDPMEEVYNDFEENISVESNNWK